MYFKFYETSADRYLEVLPIDISEDLAAEEAELFQGAIIFEADLICEKDDVIWAESSDENEIFGIAEPWLPDSGWKFVDESHLCGGKYCRECADPPLTQEEMFLRGTDRVLSEQAERRPFFSVREFQKSREPIGTVSEIRETPEGIEFDLTLNDNSVAYLGEGGTHGAYGIIGKAFGHQFCDIAGCYGKRDDCKLK